MEPGRRYTIAELADASAAALDELGIAAPNGQVRDRPDARTIRYYAALGLVDRPADMNGRTALYSERHLLQVLAVKALQARGATLADVQHILVGASEPELRTAIGPGLPGALAAVVVPAPPSRPDRPFWRMPAAAHPPAPGPAAHAPAAAAAPVAAGLTSAPAVARSGAERARGRRTDVLADDTMRPRPLIAVPLAEGATLLIEHADGTAVDIGTLRAAAAPLLAYLTEAGLLPASPTRQGATP